MCALFGWYIKPDALSRAQKTEMARALLSRADERGGDSWGYAVPIGARNFRIDRGLGRATIGIDPSNAAQHDVLYGHTRRATSGAVSRRNAHPFCVNHIVGAHNGTLNNLEQYNRLFNRNCNVDSQHIFWHISEGKDLNTLSGWGAVWYFKRHTPLELHLFKSSELLCAVYGIGTEPSNSRGAIFASSYSDVEEAAKAGGFEVFSYCYDERNLYILKDYALYKTNRTIDFGYSYGRYDSVRWQPEQTTGTALLPVRLMDKHLPRAERHSLFHDLILACDSCGAEFLVDFLALVDGLQLCPDCIKYREERKVATHHH